MIWRGYGGYEGWIIPGFCPFVLPEDASIDDKLLYCVANSEGYYDSVNCYDQAIMSVGLLQVIERGLFGVSKLLRRIEEDAYGVEWLNQQLKPFYDLTGATFTGGKWFYRGQEVKTEQQQRQLFLGCSGKLGSWTPAAKKQNQTLALCVSSVFDDALSQRIQREFMTELMWSYMWSNGKKLFVSAPNTPEANALRAVYLNLSINAPVMADMLLLTADGVVSRNHNRWTREYVVAMCGWMCGNGLPIWKSRLPSLKRAVRECWGVEL